MGTGGSYLRLTEGLHNFLLSREDMVCLEGRNRLQLNVRPTNNVVAAWLLHKGEQWPAVRLCRVLDLAAGEWTQAVFLKHSGAVLGIAAEKVEPADVRGTVIKPFNPLGGFAGKGSLYGGVQVAGAGSTPVFVARVLLDAAAAASGR